MWPHPGPALQQVLLHTYFAAIMDEPKWVFCNVLHLPSLGTDILVSCLYSTVCDVCMYLYYSTVLSALVPLPAILSSLVPFQSPRMDQL